MQSHDQRDGNDNVCVCVWVGICLFVQCYLKGESLEVQAKGKDRERQWKKRNGDRRALSQPSYPIKAAISISTLTARQWLEGDRKPRVERSYVFLLIHIRFLSTCYKGAPDKEADFQKMCTGFMKRTTDGISGSIYQLPLNFIFILIRSSWLSMPPSLRSWDKPLLQKVEAYMGEHVAWTWWCITVSNTAFLPPVSCCYLGGQEKANTLLNSQINAFILTLASLLSRNNTLYHFKRLVGKQRWSWACVFFLPPRYNQCKSQLVVNYVS